MANEKVTALTELITPASNDILYIVDDPAGTPLSKKISRANLLQIGTDVQAYDAQLVDIAGLAVTDGNFIVGNGTNWVAESGATVRASLGLGTLATQDGTFSGNGTFASGGFTLTLPATGTAALLGVANVFSTTNTFLGSIQFTNSARVLSTDADSGIALTITKGSNAVHAAVTIQARHDGVPGAGFGSSLIFKGESSTTNDQNMARLSALWNVETHASRVADGVWEVAYSGGWSEILRGRGGAAPLVGFLGATPVVRQAHIADSAGDDATAVNAILDVLEAFGLVATS